MQRESFLLFCVLTILGIPFSLFHVMFHVTRGARPYNIAMETLWMDPEGSHRELRWPCDVSRVSRGKPKSQLAFFWGDNPFLFLVKCESAAPGDQKQTHLPLAGSAICVASGDPKPDGTDPQNKRTHGQNTWKFLPQKSQGQEPVSFCCIFTCEL